METMELLMTGAISTKIKILFYKSNTFLRSIYVLTHDRAVMMKQYAQKIVENSIHLGDILSSGGLRLVSGGTENHMILADLRSMDLSGDVAEAALGLATRGGYDRRGSFSTRLPPTRASAKAACWGFRGSIPRSARRRSEPCATSRGPELPRWATLTTTS